MFLNLNWKNLQYGFYISSLFYSIVASDGTLWQAHSHTKKADTLPFLWGKGTLHMHQTERNKGQNLFPFKTTQVASLSLTSSDTQEKETWSYDFIGEGVAFLRPLVSGAQREKLGLT